MSTLVPRLAVIVSFALSGCADPAGPGGGDDPSGTETPPTPPGTDDTDDTTPPDTDTTIDPTTAAYPRPTLFEVTCDPTDNTLRFLCHVTIEPAQPVQIAFTKSDGTGTERVHTSDAVATSHDLPLYFLAPDLDYDWVASPASWPDEVVGGIVTTAAPPGDVPRGIQVSGVSTVPHVGTHSPCSAVAIAVIFDTVTGELVWYQGVDLQGLFGYFEMIQFTEDETVLGETGEHVIEVDLLGNRLFQADHTADYDENLHHDLFKKDGYIYTIFNNGFFDDPILDGFHVFDAATGAKVATWNADQHLDLPPDVEGDWTHTNTIWVDDAGDVYLSSYGQNSVIKVVGDWTSPDFGTEIWALAGAAPAGFGSSFTEDWDAIGGPDSFTHQHDVHRMDDGRLVMLDNWNGRGLVATLDEVNLTASFDESYPVTDGSQCGPQGTSAASSAGNLFFSCSGSDLYEFAPGDPDPVWAGQTQCPGAINMVIRWYPLEGW